MCDLYLDLMSLASTLLEDCGRLAFWVPVARDEYSEDRLPRHPRLRLVANCEQVFSSHTSRRLIVMEKVGEIYNLQVYCKK